MTRARLTLLIALFAMWPAGAYAQSDFIDWLDSLSGPGPFHGSSVHVRLFCAVDNGRGGHDRSTCISDTDEKIKAVFEADVAWATSGDNPRFADTPKDTQTVHMTRFGVTYSYRVSPMLDVGIGGGAMVFSGDGFDAQTHPTFTPFTVTFVPLGLMRSSPRATKWGRVLRIKYSERYIMGDIGAADFHSLSTYVKHGEFNRGLGVGFDIGSFLGH